MLSTIPDGPFSIIISCLTWKDRLHFGMSFSKVDGRMDFLYGEHLIETRRDDIINHLLAKGSLRLLKKLFDECDIPSWQFFIHGRYGGFGWRDEIRQQAFHFWRVEWWKWHFGSWIQGKGEINIYPEGFMFPYHLIGMGKFSSDTKKIYPWQVYPLLISMFMSMNKKKLVRNLIRKYMRRDNDRSNYDHGYELYAAAIHTSCIPLLNMLHGMRISFLNDPRREISWATSLAVFEWFDKHP